MTIKSLSSRLGWGFLYEKIALCKTTWGILTDWNQSAQDKSLNFILFQEPARRKSYAEILNGDDEEDEKVQMSKDKTNIYKNVQRWSLLWGRRKNASSSAWMRGLRTIYQGGTKFQCPLIHFPTVIAGTNERTRRWWRWNGPTRCRQKHLKIFVWFCIQSQIWVWKTPKSANRICEQPLMCTIESHSSLLRLYSTISCDKILRISD